jgi:hypothetical protein
MQYTKHRHILRGIPQFYSFEYFSEDTTGSILLSLGRCIC